MTEYILTPQAIAKQVIESNRRWLEGDMVTFDEKIEQSIMLGIAAYLDRTNEVPVDTSYHGLEGDREAIENAAAQLVVAASDIRRRDRIAKETGQDARIRFAASHGLAIGHALNARDLIAAFLVRNTQEGIL
jgi:hypothetical protein